MSQTNMPRKTVYIAGALTDMTEAQRAKLRKFYEDIAEVCRAFDLEPYVPHVYGDPKLVAHLTPKDIDRIDRLALTQSYLLVLYAGVPSTGVGIEIEMAYHANKPVVLMFDKYKLEQRSISRLVRGNPAIKGEIVFQDFPDALKQLRNWLATFHDDLAAEQLPPPLRPAYKSVESS